MDKKEEVSSLPGVGAVQYVFSCGVDCYYHVLRFGLKNYHYELIYFGAGGGQSKRFDEMVSSFKFKE